MRSATVHGRSLKGENSMKIRESVVGKVLNGVSYVAPGVAGLVSLTLFRRPFGRLTPRPAEQSVLESAARGTVEVRGKKVVTYRWGDGPEPVLLVHGWGLSAARMSPLASSLRARGHSVIAFDAPGHGLSEGDTTTIVEICEVVDAIQRDAGDFGAIIGHSFGALCSFHAVREGAQARSLVGIASFSRFENLVEVFQARLGLRAYLINDLRRRVEKAFAPEETNIWERFSPVGKRDGVLMPRIMLVHDENDDLASVNYSRELADVYRESVTLLITKGLGHRRILIDQYVLQRVTDFVDQSTGARTVRV
jgi:pimeloyl-ACP methyl ester carboxylesterase